MPKQKIFGLDISDHSMEAILLQRSWGRTRVVAYARTIFKTEIVSNGIIKKPAQLSERIKKLLASAKPRPITTAYCILSLPDSQAFTSVFKLPAGLKAGEIKNTLPFKAEEVIPFRSSEIYFDFSSIVKSGGTQEIFYAATPSKTINSYVEVLEVAGLIPVAFDLESVSFARSILVPKVDTKKSTKKSPSQAVLLLDIGARTTNLNIFDRNGIRQNYLVKIAGDRFTKALAVGLSLDPLAADALKMQVGFADVSKDQKNQKAGQILEKELSKLIVEIQKFIKYYATESGGQVGSVLLGGGSSLLPAIDKYLSTKLGIPVTLGNPLRKVAEPASLARFKDKAILFANVIGLGLRGIESKPASCDINLLPVTKRRFTLAPDWRDKLAWRSVYIRIAVLLLTVGVLAALIGLRQRGIDLYQQLFPVPSYEIQTQAPDISAQDLDLLRGQINLEATSTPTSTAPVVSLGTIKIRATSIGFLNVRQGAGDSFAKIGKVTAGQTFTVLAEENSWYKINYTTSTLGWVSAGYVDRLP